VNRPECTWEAAVIDALGGGGRGSMAAELRAHVAVCETCAGLVDVASALLDDRATALAAARVPTAATVWWRVQLRARREAAAGATRPITLWQGLAGACGMGVLVAAAGFAIPSVRAFVQWMVGLGPWTRGVGAESAGWAGVHWAHPATIVVILVATLFLVVMPLAVYFVHRER